MSSTPTDSDPKGVVGEVMSWTLRDHEDDIALQSLSPDDIIDKLDLSREDLAPVAEAKQRGDLEACLSALLAHYRSVHQDSAPASTPQAPDLAKADAIVDHVFQFGPYEAAAYGPDIDWEWDPRGDIEWVAVMYRFYWAPLLSTAYQATGDERYARAFVGLSSDWIAKHPLDRHRKAHRGYTNWKGFAWLDIQTGIRATNICAAFGPMVHAGAFTPRFLGILLASLYDHQVKTELLPMGKVHNKAIFEQRGFINVLHTLPEFSERPRWLKLAFARAHQSLLDQTTSDGVQREWSFGYHTAVLNDAVEIMQRMESAGHPVPDDMRQRVRLMYEYVFAIAGPDLGGPMFGDGSRPPCESRDREQWQLYSLLQQGARDLGDTAFSARANGIISELPEQTSIAFPEAGMYALRSDWSADAVQLNLHCSPEGISSHDQPDNGTFELYAYGKWLMPDSGFYTYGHDETARAWHRQTRVHQTLTLDGRDSAYSGRHLLWQSTPQATTVAVENASYQGLTHRRTIWFVDRRFFVLLDEAMGSEPGVLELQFQFAPGELELDQEARRVCTTGPDSNVLITAAATAPLELTESEGWSGWAYGARQRRPACCFRHGGQAPACFVTAVAPFAGVEQPQVRVPEPTHIDAGSPRVELTVDVDGVTWSLRRDLDTGAAWAESVG
jgi:heparan-sulfate lyase